MEFISLRHFGQQGMGLLKIKGEYTWKQLLESEDTAASIQATIERIDHALEAFQVGSYDYPRDCTVITRL